MRRRSIRRWTLDERIGVQAAFRELLASGVFGATQDEVQKNFDRRLDAVSRLGKGTAPWRAAFEAFLADLDRAVPGVSARLFPIASEALRSVPAPTTGSLPS